MDVATTRAMPPAMSAATTGVMPRALGHVLVWSALAIVAFSAFVLVGLDGWSYYTAAPAVRPQLPAHQWLRPSAPAGHLFGITGFLLMLAPVAYSMRKKIRLFRNAGSMKTWIEVHVFCGILGPVLVTFHTTFKFNGIVSVAYWSMVAVTLSGFVGRYLYVRIPKSLRGLELTGAELDARAHEFAARLAAAALPPPLRTSVEAFERRSAPLPRESISSLGLLRGELRMRRDLAALRRDIANAGVAPELLGAAVRLIAERATLVRQTAYLTKTKRLFDLWHVFHMPLVYVMFGIVAVHVAVTVYMGYVPFRY
jgi:hypothetical protein